MFGKHLSSQTKRVTTFYWNELKLKLKKEAIILSPVSVQIIL
mgnify:CR=1 FL=1